MMARVVLLLTIVVVSCYGQSQKCCLPPQWEGLQSELGGIVADQHGEAIVQNIAVSYDATNKRLSTIVNATVGQQQTTIWVISHYKEGVMYRIELKTKQCQKIKITSQMPPACVPDEAKRVGSVSFGGGSSKIMCDVYQWSQKEAEFDVQVYLTATRDGNVCYPVTEGLMGTVQKMPTVETFGFVDLTKGIKDPSIFTPPPSCNQAPFVNTAEKPQVGFLLF